MEDTLIAPTCRRMGRPPADLAGLVFSLLTVIDRAPSDARGNTRWRCRCVCRREVVVRADHLRAGQDSCGCRVSVRRRSALAALRDGLGTQAAIARDLGVSRQAVGQYTRAT